MSVHAMREASAARKPRPIVVDVDELHVLLEASDPPLALSSTEVDLVVGAPPAAPLAGLRSFAHDQHLVYRRLDGRDLRFEYEGALAYALVEIDEDPGRC